MIVEHGSNLLELIGTVFGFAALMTAFIPELRKYAAILSAAHAFYKLLSGYLRTHPEKTKELNHIITEMTSHYLHTHPVGKEIARCSDADEKATLVLKHDSEVEGVG